MACASWPIIFISVFWDSNPFFSWVNAATIDDKAAPNDPAKAATEPPPGAGLLLESSFVNPSTDSDMSFPDFSPTANSIIFSSGANGVTSFNPKDWIADSMISDSGTPMVRPCFWR